MHSKIINPSLHGSKTYDNKGSCAVLVNYLSHEAREKQSLASFFNGEREGISPEEVRQGIDTNIKGLRKGEIKFHSLIISPSPQELKHLCNRDGEPDPAKLKAFTIQAMQNYAQNFHLANGQKLNQQDLVWYATIHQHRTYKGNDREVKEGAAKSGEVKPGPHTHVHVIVSKREKEQKITLNPLGRKERFEMVSWQRQNQQSFEKQFGYVTEVRSVNEELNRRNPSSNQRPGQLVKAQQTIYQRVESINTLLPKYGKLDEKKVLNIAEDRSYGKAFFRSLYRVEHHLKKGRPVHDPMHLLKHDRDAKPERLGIGVNLQQAFRTLAAEGEILGRSETLAMPTVKGRQLHRNPRSGHSHGVGLHIE